MFGEAQLVCRIYVGRVKYPRFTVFHLILYLRESLRNHEVHRADVLSMSPVMWFHLASYCDVSEDDLMLP